ncbi:hypothetical protein [Nostoc sp.]
MSQRGEFSTAQSCQRGKSRHLAAVLGQRAIASEILRFTHM